MDILMCSPRLQVAAGGTSRMGCVNKQMVGRGGRALNVPRRRSCEARVDRVRHKDPTATDGVAMRPMYD